MSSNCIMVPQWTPVIQDPSFADVSLLLPFDSFPFTDVKGHTVNNLNSTLTTANTAYGGAATFNGIDTALRIPAAADLAMGTGDFCQEARIRLASYPGAGQQHILWTNAPSTNTAFANTTIGLNLQPGGNVRVQSSYAVFLSSATVLPLNQELHIAFSRINGTLRLFINGVEDGAAASSHNFSELTEVMIGKEAFNSNNVGATMNGQISELRFTKGNGRYSGGFAVPSAFPTA